MSSESIREKEQTIKCRGVRIVCVIILVLIAVISFVLGQISIKSSFSPSVEEATYAKICPQAENINGAVYASWYGRSYYAPWCKSHIKYKRWFQSEQAALTAGYRPARNCRGLIGDVNLR